MSSRVTDCSPRELGILRAMPSQRTCLEMCDALGITHNTVKTHGRAVHPVLDSTSRREVVSVAHRRGPLTARVFDATEDAGRRRFSRRRHGQ